MKNPIKLKSFIEELEIQFDESRTFRSLETGEIISFTSEEIRAAEEDEPFEHLPQW